MASERYSERVQKITREGGAGSMEKPKIAFDVDGVLGDFLYQYSRYHKKIYPDSGIDFRMITDYGVPAACGILWSLPGFYESMPVMEGAKELVREAGLLLDEARGIHRQAEAFYTSAMDFSKADAALERLCTSLGV